MSNSYYVNVKYLKARYNVQTRQKEFEVYDVKSQKVPQNTTKSRNTWTGELHIDPKLYAKEKKKTYMKEYAKRLMSERDFENVNRSGIHVSIEDEPCDTCEDLEKVIHIAHREQY